ncbi:MAG: hypothetical protein QG604_268 [Candidatus Dependentiae bacterium]|nr:hypothetical protein [Candidatus Dependentiae bacterium]
MLIFLLSILLLITPMQIAASRVQAMRQPQVQPAPQAATPPAQPPAFSALQASLDNLTMQAADIGNTVLHCFKMTYNSIDNLLNQRADEWRSYFGSSTSAASAQYLTNKINEGNTWLNNIPAAPAETAGTSLTPEMIKRKVRHEKALNGYIAAATKLSATLKALAFQNPLPTIVIPAAPSALAESGSTLSTPKKSTKSKPAPLSSEAPTPEPVAIPVNPVATTPQANMPLPIPITPSASQEVSFGDDTP